MKRAIFILTILTGLASPIFAQEDEVPRMNFFTTTPKWSINTNFILSDSKSNLSLMPVLSFRAVADLQELYCTLGIQVEAQTLNLTTKVFYSPTICGNLNVGPCTILNFAFTPGYYNEVNFLTGIFLKFTPCRWFTLKHTILYLCKASYIDTGMSGSDKYHEILDYKNYALDLAFVFHPIPQFGIALRFTTFDEYKYYLAYCPMIKLDLSADLKRFSIGAGVSLEYIDFCTLSGNLNSIDYKVFFTWRI